VRPVVRSANAVDGILLLPGDDEARELALESEQARIDDELIDDEPCQ
jgi:hypothetical protein